MPLIVSAQRKYAEQIHFLGVDVQDDDASAEAFAKRYKMRFPSLGDPQKRIVRAEGLLGLPVTLFYREDGELAFVHNGPIGRRDLQENIQQLLLLSKTKQTS
jgi:peroxiredoxin